MSEQRYFIKLSYKGTHFFGWQRQPNAITVQEHIEDALKKMNRNKAVKIMGCGRTDTGVHATEFYAHFEMNPEWDDATFAYKLNCMIPNDIAIHEVIKVPADLHARFSATSRTYHYFIHSEKDPFLNETSWLEKQELDLDKMNAACKMLINHKNFKCFSKTITGISSFNCDVTEAQWTKTPEGYRFSIQANRFLRNMVRAIVGTMVDIGTDKIDFESFQKILDSEERSKAGLSVPPQGLFLVKVAYDNDKNYIS
ncbi:MAG: tRNA pseudouridine(38-40) synthase TruA [Crocinitomix sp.]|nr:tRNA pseudouridine(38-40) synthase TruA [Crocinitomix sp.]